MTDRVLVAQVDAFAAVVAQRDQARRIAVQLEQELAEAEWRIRAAADVAEQLGCLCQFIPDDADKPRCAYCALRDVLAAVGATAGEAAK